jgi:hypothetical protein
MRQSQATGSDRAAPMTNGSLNLDSVTSSQRLRVDPCANVTGV